MIAATAIPKKNDRVAARVVEGKALIVVIDSKQLHTLNEVGTRVWELCDGRSLDAIAEAMLGEFEIDKLTLLRDVERFVGELRALGAIELEAQP